ncbi:MAG: response regulator, partial [Daejeonella sp.]|nr:response regulator [Daejeonella sp.]
RIFLIIQKRMVVMSGLHDSPLVFINGREALDFIQASADEDRSFLILLDINMPVMNGWEFLDTISGTFSIDRVRVVVVSSSVNVVDKEKANQYRHVISYLEKPIKPESLTALKTII